MSGKFGQKQDRTRIVLPDSAPTSQSWQHFDPLQRPPGSLHDFFDPFDYSLNFEKSKIFHFKAEMVIFE